MLTVNTTSFEEYFRFDPVREHDLRALDELAPTRKAGPRSNMKLSPASLARCEDLHATGQPKARPSRSPR